MKITNRLLTLMVGASSLVLLSCDADDTLKDITDDLSKSTLTVDITGLAALASDEKYEGWLIVDGTPVSTGLFTTDKGGSFEVDAAMAAKATKFVLTIEPSPDSDAAPSALKILAGDFDKGSATVSVATGPALGTGADFSTASGKYIVAAPTTDDAAFDKSGIWFLDNSGATPVAGLSLPALGSDWVYEGWVVGDNGPISTGTFTSVTGADNASPHSDGGPEFPGEDFITDAPTGYTFPLDVSMLTAVISIEPAVDNDPAPFQFKPLVGTGGTMEVKALPTGTATIK